MTSEEIIMMVFVGVILLSVPFVSYMIYRDKKREEEENRKPKH